MLPRDRGFDVPKKPTSALQRITGNGRADRIARWRWNRCEAGRARDGKIRAARTRHPVADTRSITSHAAFVFVIDEARKACRLRTRRRRRIGSEARARVLLKPLNVVALEAVRPPEHVHAVLATSAARTDGGGRSRPQRQRCTAAQDRRGPLRETHAERRRSPASFAIALA